MKHTAHYSVFRIVVLIVSSIVSAIVLPSAVSRQSPASTGAAQTSLEFPATLLQKIEAGKTPVGTEVSAKLLMAMPAKGDVIPAGATLVGYVAESEAKGKNGPSKLKIHIDAARWSGGEAKLNAYLTPEYHAFSFTWDADRRHVTGMSRTPNSQRLPHVDADTSAKGLVLSDARGNVRLDTKTIFVFEGSVEEVAATTLPDVPVQQTTFTARAELVTVPVVITDKNGDHITGLKASDFRLSHDGQESRIAVFEEIISPVGKPLDKPFAIENVFTNQRTDQLQHPPLTILVLDTLNTQFEDAAWARQNIIKFIKENVGRDSLIALMTFGQSGISLVHDFTSDRRVLLAALDGTGKQSPQAYDSDLQQRIQGSANEIAAVNEFKRGAFSQVGCYWTRRTLRSLEQLAQAYAGVPGRKSMIWVTDGIPFQPDVLLMATTGRLPAGQDSCMPQEDFERAWQALNNSGFAVYPVDAAGLQTVPRHPLDDLNRIDNLHSSFAATAIATGGKAFYNSNDVAAEIKKAVADSEQYYLLGFYLEKPPSAGWHGIKVTAPGIRAEVRSRTGFMVPKPNAKSKINEIAAAILSPLDYTSLPFQVRLDPYRRDAGGPSVRVPFDIIIPPEANLLRDDTDHDLAFDVVASARRADGKVVGVRERSVIRHLSQAESAQVRRSGATYTGALVVPRGELTVTFVVRDRRSGVLGSVRAPLTNSVKNIDDTTKSGSATKANN